MLTQDHLNLLYALLQKLNLLRIDWLTTSMPSVGGSVRWATYTADGVIYSIPRENTLADPKDPNTLYNCVSDAIVPKSIWRDLEKQRTKYQHDYAKAHNSP